MKEGEHEPDVIERILGKKWKNAFCAGSSLLMFIVGVVYFLLINNNLYAMITTMMHWCKFYNY
jgi:sodium-coupled neutral amino acid transporter 9